MRIDLWTLERGVCQSEKLFEEWQTPRFGGLFYNMAGSLILCTLTSICAYIVDANHELKKKKSQ